MQQHAAGAGADQVLEHTLEEDRGHRGLRAVAIQHRVVAIDGHRARRGTETERRRWLGGAGRAMGAQRKSRIRAASASSASSRAVAPPSPTS